MSFLLLFVKNPNAIKANPEPIKFKADSDNVASNITEKTNINTPNLKELLDFSVFTPKKHCLKIM